MIKKYFFQVAIDRYKRLDWGMYIRTQGGRNSKHYAQDPVTLWRKEQHIFGAPFHVRWMNRMFGPKTKAKRYLPDDPYEKYHQTSFFKHYALWYKNKVW